MLTENFSKIILIIYICFIFIMVLSVVLSVLIKLFEKKYWFFWWIKNKYIFLKTKNKNKVLNKEFLFYKIFDIDKFIICSTKKRLNKRLKNIILEIRFSNLEVDTFDNYNPNIKKTKINYSDTIFSFNSKIFLKKNLRKKLFIMFF